MDFEKTTVNLRAGDYKKLSQYCINQGIPTSTVIRLLISSLVDKLDRDEVTLADVLGAQ